MKGVVIYSLHDYIRSHKYFPPVSTFVILIFVFYTYKPNPVIDSYAITAVFVYIISAWLCISMLSLDPPVQRQLMSLHMKSWNRYYVAKLIAVGIISILLSIFAFLYPIIFDMFDESLTFSISLVSLFNHVLLAMLGISVACLFSKVLMNSSINSFGGLALVIVVSIAALGIAKVLPSFLKHLVWVIPPATSTQIILFNWDGTSLSGLSLLPFLWIMIYSLVLVLVFLQLAKRMR